MLENKIFELEKQIETLKKATNINKGMKSNN